MSGVKTKSRPVYVKKYNSWRIRILYSIIVGYSTFYFCRQNFNIAMPDLIKDFSVTKTELGWILTASSITYGIGKLLNGFLSDRSNARNFMFLGLFFVGIITLLTSFVNSLWIIGIFWIANNWFQSMGWPPATRMLTRWYTQKELGVKWSLGAASNQLGGALTMIICGYLVNVYGWRMAFFVPGVVAIIVSLFLLNRLRNAPSDVGLPLVEEYKECLELKSNDNEPLSASSMIKVLLSNNLIWYICIANMFVYIVRIGIIYWAPLFLHQLRNVSILDAGWQVGTYEVLGLVGGVAAGWMSDRFFDGRRAPVGFMFMFFLSISLSFFWLLPAKYEELSLIFIALAGFFVSGPQVLIGIATADCISKNLVGTANGLAGLFGYLGAALAGVCVGWISDNYGWDGVFVFFILSSLLGGVFFGCTWNTRVQ